MRNDPALELRCYHSVILLRRIGKFGPVDRWLHSQEMGLILLNGTVLDHLLAVEYKSNIRKT